MGGRGEVYKYDDTMSILHPVPRRAKRSDFSYVYRSEIDVYARS